MGSTSPCGEGVDGVQVTRLIARVALGQDSGVEPEWVGLSRSHQDPARHLLRHIDDLVDDFLVQKYGRPSQFENKAASCEDAK
jgi:hypothetical protein